MKSPTFRDVLLWLFSLYFTIMFFRNGWRKFDPEGFWSGAFERWGYPTWFMFFIGFLEVAGALLILIPKLRGYGALTLAVVMAGAFITRAIHGMGFADASAIAFYCIAMLLLFQESTLYQSILGKTHSKEYPAT